MSDLDIKQALVVMELGGMTDFGYLTTRMTWERINNTDLFQEAMREAEELKKKRGDK